MYQDTDYGAEVLEAVTDEVAEHSGVSLVSSVGTKPTDTEFVGAMVGFKGAGCDLIVFGTIIRDTITGYATARKLGITADVVVTQAGFDTMVAAFPGGITEGLYAVSVGEAVYCDSAPASAQAFCDAYKAKYGNEPGISGQLGYTAADLVVAGLENAGADLTVDSLMDGLESISDHQDIFGRIGWSYGADDHIGTQVVVLSQVEGSKWVTLGQVTY
jgi:branched-chain amino acid transport system substrate-binding protein